jgi:hypothetical protein
LEILLNDQKKAAKTARLLQLLQGCRGSKLAYRARWRKWQAGKEAQIRLFSRFSTIFEPQWHKMKKPGQWVGLLELYWACIQAQTGQEDRFGA